MRKTGKSMETEGNTRDPETKPTASETTRKLMVGRLIRFLLGRARPIFKGKLAVSFTEGKYEGGLRDSERCFMKWNFNACNIVAMRFRYSAERVLSQNDH